MSENVCFFVCNKVEKLISAGPTRIKTIIKSSKERDDILHKSLETLLQSDPNSTLQCHKSCVSSYTSKDHISRNLKRRNITHGRPQSEPPLRRSKLRSFNFKEDCILCGEPCKLPDPRHPDRWRVVVECHTTNRPGQKTFKESLLEKCAERNDSQADEVRVRLSGATADLRAADARYHRDCYKNFTSARNVYVAQCKGIPVEEIRDPAFMEVVALMYKDPSRMWTTVELHEAYCSGSSVHQACKSRRQFITKLCDYFGETILEMRIQGCASFICFRQHIPYKLYTLKDEQDDVDLIVDKIKAEVKSIPKSNDYNLNQFVKESSIKGTSPTLLSLISRLVSSGDITKPSLSIAQSIQSHISKSTNATTLGLAVKLHHRFGSKELVSLLNDYGYISTYDEVLKFKKSAAKYIGEQEFLLKALKPNNCKVSAWFDNYDLQIFTPNGSRETHSMAIEFTQPTLNNEIQDDDSIVIPRLSKCDITNLKLSKLSPIQFEHYKGPRDPLPPLLNTHVGRCHISSTDLFNNISDAIQADVSWLNSIITCEKAIEWSGYMKKLAREGGLSCKPTKFVFGPLIDATPNHPDTVLTTLLFIEKFIQQHGQTYIHISADMQLFKLTMMIKWSNPRRWKNLIPRPGGMHTLMSFIGCIGTLMQCSGLEELLKAAFKGVSNMLNGKAWPKAVRGMRMVLTCLFEDFLSCEQKNISEIEIFLEEACKTPTGKLWVDCFIIPVVIVHLFIRAEREGNWRLHVYSMERMIPYFFAAGHWQYSRYITWHVLEMKQELPDEVFTDYDKGDYVCRHREGVWNSVSSDQFGEQTYIRYGKSRGGLIGLTLSPDQVAGWVLSNNICNMISLKMDKMFGSEDNEYNEKLDIHKEEGRRRQILDSSDREKIRKELKNLIHPLKPESKNLVNIANGCIADARVNVQDALIIGERMANKFKRSLPGCFYKPLHQEVVTMKTMLKNIKVGDSAAICDMDKLITRLIILSQKREISLEYLFQFELAPVSSALFDEYGKMRKSSKTAFVKQLAIESHIVPIPDVVIYDGNEMLYSCVWPKSGTVKHLSENLNRAVNKNNCEAFVIFDKYAKESIKTHERNRHIRNVLYSNHDLKIDSTLPARDVVMHNTHNKQLVISLLCDNNTDTNIKMIDTKRCMFQHEEADINIISYILFLIEQNKKKIQVVADDNDIFLLLLYFVFKWKKRDVQVTMKKANGFTVDINASVENLGEKCNVLLPLHALTGCDSTSYPFGKGKMAALNLLRNHDLQFLQCFGELNFIKDEIIRAGHKFFCLLYGSNNQDISLKKLRYDIFSGKKDTPKIKSLPPTDEAAEQHFLRAHLQMLLWKAADLNGPPETNIEVLGWKLVNGIPDPVVGVDLMAPPELMKIVACGCSTDAACFRKNCSCNSNGLSCTLYCKCSAESHQCNNPHTKHDVQEHESTVSLDEDE